LAPPKTTRPPFFAEDKGARRKKPVRPRSNGAPFGTDAVTLVGLGGKGRSAPFLSPSSYGFLLFPPNEEELSKVGRSREMRELLLFSLGRARELHARFSPPRQKGKVSLPSKIFPGHLGRQLPPPFLTASRRRASLSLRKKRSGRGLGQCPTWGRSRDGGTSLLVVTCWSARRRMNTPPPNGSWPTGSSSSLQDTRPPPAKGFSTFFSERHHQKGPRCLSRGEGRKRPPVP